MIINLYQKVMIIIIYQIMYSEFYEQMSKSYSSIHMWPQPYAYMQWHQSLPAEYKTYYMTPELYNQNYEFSIRKYNESLKKPKLSRNQKRAEKKKKLKEEL